MNESEQLQIQVTEMRTNLLGVEHPDTLYSMAKLASIYRDQGRDYEAEKLEVEVMNIKVRIGRN